MSSATTAPGLNRNLDSASPDVADTGENGAAATEQAGTSDPAGRVTPGRVTIDRYGLDLGPWLHLAEERARLARPSFDHIEVVPQGATLGAEVSGVDLGSDLGDEAIAEIRRALLDYKVLVFRDQPITPAQHVAFARRFGELEIHPFITGNSEHPELVRFEKGVDTGGFENGWHHDVTWREVPSMGAILHAIEVPATGGDTLFSDMGAAYDGLDDAVRERIANMFAVHDFMLAFKQQVPEGKQAEFRARYPLARHPVVCTHPETGRKLIFVNCYLGHGLSASADHRTMARITPAVGGGVCAFSRGSCARQRSPRQRQRCGGGRDGTSAAAAQHPARGDRCRAGRRRRGNAQTRAARDSAEPRVLRWCRRGPTHAADRSVRSEPR